MNTSPACWRADFLMRCSLPNILALMDFYKGSYETVLSRGGQMGLLDPIPMLCTPARVTKHIGLGGSVSSSFVHAFQTGPDIRDDGSPQRRTDGMEHRNDFQHAAMGQFRNGTTACAMNRYDFADEVVEALHQAVGQLGSRMH